MNKRGFTLVESLVVVSIIALLVSILLPALSKAREQAKIVVCASNQHQLLTGVQLYATDYDGRMPPTIQGCDINNNGKAEKDDVWTCPKQLNYHAGGLQPEGFHGGSMGRIMKEYLPVTDVYNCPASPFSPDRLWTNSITGAKETYQELYEKGEMDFMGCSYFLLWNYHGFDNNLNETPFAGAERDYSENSLIVADAAFYNENDLPEHWRITHRFERADKKANDIYYSISDASQTIPSVSLNAGYTDGRVERFSSNDTVEMRALIANYVSMYIPRYFR